MEIHELSKHCESPIEVAFANALCKVFKLDCARRDEPATPVHRHRARTKVFRHCLPPHRGRAAQGETNCMNPSEILRPLSTLPAGKKVTIVLRDGSTRPAHTTMVYVGDSAGVIAYDNKTRGAIPREQIKGWIA